MNLDIANGTMQNCHFQFRCPKTRNLREIKIRAGGQSVVDLDYDMDEMARVERQLVQAKGAVRVNDVKSITGPYALIYSIGVNKPISSDSIDSARVRDQEVRQDIAATVTEQSGLAMFRTIETKAPQGLHTAELDVQQLEVSSDDPVKSGVSYKATVSRSAGKKQDGRRNAA